MRSKLLGKNVLWGLGGRRRQSRRFSIMLTLFGVWNLTRYRRSELKPLSGAARQESRESGPVTEGYRPVHVGLDFARDTQEQEQDSFHFPLSTFHTATERMEVRIRNHRSLRRDLHIKRLASKDGRANPPQSSLTP
ncbi:uncharacterized protein LOC131153599 [Malania oleifera]|uniref:uncharacterized protein LOC131153599 n=1 Tax=Malania oleifera TaxID=397392 RepID=UPI0025AEB589|nr:uncharacterized protein LOC131153599 [Malania oleifera]